MARHSWNNAYSRPGRSLHHGAVRAQALPVARQQDRRTGAHRRTRLTVRQCHSTAWLAPSCAGALPTTSPARFTAAADPAALAECDAILICVPTPLANQREPDLSYIADAGEAVAGILRQGQLVVLESTTYPGTTRERLLPILEQSGLTAGSVSRSPRVSRRAGPPAVGTTHRELTARSCSRLGAPTATTALAPSGVRLGRPQAASSVMSSGRTAER